MQLEMEKANPKILELQDEGKILKEDVDTQFNIRKQAMNNHIGSMINLLYSNTNASKTSTNQAQEATP